MVASNAYKRIELIIIAAAAIFVLLGPHSRSGSDPAMSRLATVYSLANDGTFNLDRPLAEEPIEFEQRTIDKVMVRGRNVGGGVAEGHIISSKPPVLSLMMTGEYVLMNKFLGWDLENPDDMNRSLLWFSITLVGGAYVLGLICFARLLSFYVPTNPFVRVLLLGCLAFATEFWGFSTMLNNHMPAAGAMIAALYYALGMLKGYLPPAPWRFFAFGFLAGLTHTLDIPATIFVACAGIPLLIKWPKQAALWAGLGILPPLAVHIGVLWVVTGSPLPVQMREATYLFEYSYWRTPIQIDALNEPKGTYLFHMLVGRNGVFALFPILLAGVAGALRALVQKETPHRGSILVGAGAILCLCAYYFTKNNYGGESYGFRWLIIAMPVLLLMGAPILTNLRAHWRWVFVALMIGISFFSAWESTTVGWRANQEWTSRFLGPSY